METQISTSPHVKIPANERACLKEIQQNPGNSSCGCPLASKFMSTDVHMAMLGEAHLQSQHSMGVGQKQEKCSKREASLGYTTEF